MKGRLRPGAIPENTTVSTVLRWDDLWASSGGPGITRDLDSYRNRSGGHGSIYQLWRSVFMTEQPE